MKKYLNSTFLIIGAIVLAALAYWYFFTGSSSSSQTLTASAVQQTGAEAQFETLIAQLTPITFNTAILSDPRFTALVDLSTPITPEPLGRSDPFAPIPGVSAK